MINKNIVILGGGEVGEEGENHLIVIVPGNTTVNKTLFVPSKTT